MLTVAQSAPLLSDGSRSFQHSVEVSASAVQGASDSWLKGAEARVAQHLSQLTGTAVIARVSTLSAAPGLRARRLQDTVSLRIDYSVVCSANCEDIGARLNALSSDADHAQGIIDAINLAAQAAGFGQAVVSSPQDIMASITAPSIVSIDLPPPPPVAPSEPVAPADWVRGSCPDAGYSDVTHFWFDVVTSGTEILDTQWTNELNTWNHDDGYLLQTFS